MFRELFWTLVRPGTRVVPRPRLRRPWTWVSLPYYAVVLVRGPWVP